MGLILGVSLPWSLKLRTSRAASNDVVLVGGGRTNTQVLGSPPQEPFCFDPFYKLVFFFQLRFYLKKKKVHKFLV